MEGSKCKLPVFCLVVSTVARHCSGYCSNGQITVPTGNSLFKRADYCSNEQFTIPTGFLLFLPINRFSQELRNHSWTHWHTLKLLLNPCFQFVHQTLICQARVQLSCNISRVLLHHQGSSNGWIVCHKLSSWKSCRRAFIQILQVKR